MNSDGAFRGKTVLITGGSEGVGAAAARRFAAAGARLVLVARGAAKLEAVAGRLAGSEVMVCPMDVTDTEACRGLMEQTQARFGSLHVLVNNAGYHARGAVAAIDPAALGRMIDVNLRAPIVLSRLALPLLRKSPGSAIVNVASLAGRTPVRGAAAYSASKFGLRAFTFALGEELREEGVRVAAVSPGPIDTGFIMSDIDSVADITFSQPMSTADEVAEIILQLAVGGVRERSMPPVSGLLTTVSYLFPSFARLLQPALNRKGRKVKQRLKARLRGDGTA